MSLPPQWVYSACLYCASSLDAFDIADDGIDACLDGGVGEPLARPAEGVTPDWHVAVAMRRHVSPVDDLVQAFPWKHTAVACRVARQIGRTATELARRGTRASGITAVTDGAMRREQLRAKA